MTDGPPTYDEMMTLFGINGVHRKAEAVRGMTLLLDSWLFRHPAEFAKVWSAYSEAAEKTVNLTREEVSPSYSSLFASVGGASKEGAPRPTQGSTDRNCWAVSGCIGPEYMQYSMLERRCRQV